MLTIHQSPREVVREIDLKDHGKFQLVLQKPTYAQLAEDAQQQPGYLEQRIRNSLVGWRDVEINGESQEFSWELFQTVCEHAPAVFHLASAVISDLYYSFGDDAKKNSKEASSDS